MINRRILSLMLTTHKTYDNKVKEPRVSANRSKWSNWSTICLITMFFVISGGVSGWNSQCPWIHAPISVDLLEIGSQKRLNLQIINCKTKKMRISYCRVQFAPWSWPTSPQSSWRSSSSCCSSLWSPLSLGLDKQLEQRRLWAEELAIVDGQIQGLEMELRQQARWIFYLWFSIPVEQTKCQTNLSEWV